MNGWIEHLRTELSALKRAPISVVFFLALGGAIGFWIATNRYEGTIGSLKGQIALRDDKINNYQVALGIKAPSDGSLIGLRNDELRALAMKDAAELHVLYLEMQRQEDALFVDFERKKLSQRDIDKIREDIKVRAEKKFMNTRAEVFLVDGELRRRLSGKSLDGTLIIAPQFEMNLLSLVGADFQVLYLDQLAQELESMARLLPPDK